MAIEPKIKSTFEKAFETLNMLKIILESLRINKNKNSPYTEDMIDLPMGFINEYTELLEIFLKNQTFTLRGYPENLITYL